MSTQGGLKMWQSNLGMKQCQRKYLNKLPRGFPGRIANILSDDIKAITVPASSEEIPTHCVLYDSACDLLELNL